MNCGCENTREIFPDVDMTRWQVQCSSYIEDADNYYTKKQVDDLIESATSSGNCCITEEEVDEKITSAKTEIENEIPTVPTSNTAFTNDAGYLTEHQSLSGYATEQWVLDQNYITGVDLSNYATKSEIPTVPTSNTAFTNDAGYLTEHQSLSAYSTTDEVNSAITQAVSGKQDTLTAGRGISIANNTVAFNLPIYLGGKSSSISITQPTGNTQYDNKSNGFSSTAIGAGLNAQNQYEVAVGVHNVERPEVQGVAFGGSGCTLFTVGNGCGSSSTQRHNALEIRQNGDIYISDTNASGTFCEKPMIKLQDHLGGGGGTGTTYTAGDGISISNQNVISTTTKFWCGTQGEYDQITTKDPNTVYMIHS